MIKNLIFDFGKVLVNHDLHAVLERYFKGDKETEERFCAILASPAFTEACDRGLIPFEELIRETRLKYPHFSDAFHFFHDNYLEEVTGEIEGMQEVLRKLKTKGFKLYGLSNWSSTVYEVMRKYEIFNLLDGRVISCEEHVIKPDKEIYLRLCERYGLEPAECLFTDDRMENVEGAKSVGMDAVLFTTPENYAADVERIYPK
ncbi:HAD family phosphatase [uncultured Bacteroides sp.]|uniref:HAD family hydrolase n=1 Tax=uncultured Bacteroides sp. TaxID=162156 RepID=UPI0025EA65C6|nr:HAD family phosphatase [uncultured Bacteroides sp.]